MTIVYCTDTIYRSGGIESVVTQKANYLAEHCGCQVYIVTFHQKGRKPFFELSPKVKTIDLGINIRLPFTKFFYKKKLASLIESIGADVCISVSGKELFPISEMNLPCSKIAEFHFSYKSYYIRKKQRRLPSFIKAASKMDKFVVLTKEDALEWNKVLNNVVQIYNPSTKPTTEAEKSRKLRCISGGRLVPQKNYAAMLRVWKEVAQDFPEWKLEIYGTGKQHSELSEMIQRLGLNNSVNINPPTNQFNKELSDSSIYLMTSIYEGFPMVLVEAAAAGVPAIAYACPTGPAETIIDGKTGFVVPEGDIITMADRLRTLMSDYTLRLEMGKEAQKQCSRFNIELIMNQWMELFRSL